MSVAALLPSPVYKECRALALPWLACVACMLSIAVSDSPHFFGPFAFIAYLVGTIALGALSIGHEYTGRTLSLLLTLPARREGLLATKLGVLTGMLLTLWLVADTFVFNGMPAPADTKQMLALIPVLCALFLAPWLTMACRSSIAGTVFAFTIPGVLGVAGEFIGIAKYGHGPVMEAFWVTFMWSGTLGLCAVGAVMSWRMFMRLEALDGPGPDVRLPQWLTAGRAAGAAEQHMTRRNPVWLLMKKEVRLQQLPLALSALYVVEFLAAIAAASTINAKYGDLFSGLTFLHAGLVPLLVGSTASAGERQIDTLQSQLLLPMASGKQWAVKVLVVFALSIALALVLPAALFALSPWTPASPLRIREFVRLVIPVMLLASGSLYVSSLCRSGLWALLMSIPAVVGSVMFVQLVLQRVAAAAYFAAGGTLSRFRPMYFLPFRAMSLLIIAGFIAFALRFAFINHRSADRPAKRVLMQVIVMAVLVAVGIAAGAAWQALR